MVVFHCPHCAVVFTRKFNRDRHVNVEHNHITIVHSCVFCGAVFNTIAALRVHRKNHQPTTGFEVFASAHKKKCVIFRKSYESIMADLNSSFLNDKEDIYKLLRYELANRNSMKTSIVFYAEFTKFNGTNENGEEADRTRYQVCIRSQSCLLTNEGDILNLMDSSLQSAQNRIDDFIENGSGWRLDEIVCTNIEIGNCRPLNGSCNLLSITYPKALKRIKPADKLQQCFLEAVAYHFIKSSNVSLLQTFINENLRVNISTPVSITSIPRFENDNKHLDLKINVLYMEEQKDIFPLYFSRQINAANIITLLLYKTVIDNNLINHYCYVENVNTLLQKKFLGRTITYERAIRCLNCLAKFSSKTNAAAQLASHYKLCLENKPQSILPPRPGATLFFKNYERKFKMHFVGFFDFESAHHKPKFSCEKCAISDGNDCKHSTSVCAIQKPITVSYLILNTNTNEIMHKMTYTGEDCVEVFLNELLTIETEFDEYFNEIIPMQDTPETEMTYLLQEKCHICEKMLADDRVRDHCHITGKFLGAAHNHCNLNRQEKKQIPMFCHNLTGYDGHFLLQKLGGDERIKKLNALPYNTEKFRTIELNSYLFLDSLSFLNASLNELMNDLLKNKTHKFDILDQLGLYKKEDEKEKKMLLRKGVYCYEYVTSIQRLKDTKTIPPKEYFFSSLTNSNISDDDYVHAQEVFKQFKCCDMVDYTELYCSMDVGILAEIVIQFRNLVYDSFGLDCCHYISTPQLAFDSMLRSTKVEIELLTDIDQILFIENNIRGGVSFINQRHCEKGVDAKGFETSMAYIDANNLYGLAQCYPMPLKNFRWLTNEEIQSLDWADMNDDQESGYILEVDLAYPQHLHAAHSSLPLAPHRLKITQEMLSPYAAGTFILLFTISLHNFTIPEKAPHNKMAPRTF